MTELTIDREFSALLMPLSDDEQHELERSIIDRGCLVPVFTWRGIIIDGHTRYRICQKHKLAFPTQEMYFGDRTEARDWIILHQLGRRNITPDQASYLRGKLFASKKEEKGGIAAIEDIAARGGVAKRTVRNDAKFAAAVERLPDDMRAAALSPNSKATRKMIIEAARIADKDERAEAARMAIFEGKAKRPSTDVAREPVRDMLGREVPESIRPVFEELPALRLLLRSLRCFKTDLDACCARPAGYWLQARKQQVVEAISTAQTIVRDSLPHCIVPDGFRPPRDDDRSTSARAAKCGWITKPMYEAWIKTRIPRP